MDEKEFEKLLQESYKDPFINAFVDGNNKSPNVKTIQQLQIEEEESARNKQASNLEQAKKNKELYNNLPWQTRMSISEETFLKTNGKSQDFSPTDLAPLEKSSVSYIDQFVKNTAAKAGAMILDLSYLLDVGDWHNYMPEATKNYWLNPLYGLSKDIDYLFGDKDNLEVGNFVGDFSQDVRNYANRYYTDYGEGAKKTKIPGLGWSVEETINGTSDLIGSVAGVLATGGAVRALGGGLVKAGMSQTAAARAAQVASMGAMTMAVSGSIGAEVYDNVQEHWLESQDPEYKSSKLKITNDAIKRFYAQNPGATQAEVQGFVDDEIDTYREQYMLDPKNAEKVTNAKRNAVIGTDVALKTNFVFGLATNFVIGNVVARGINKFPVTTASTRKFSEVLKKDGTKTVKKNKTLLEKFAWAGEGISEAAEEAFFEQYAQKSGELAGKAMDYGFSDVMQEFNYDETLKSAIFGFAGGAGTVAVFDAIDANSLEAKAQFKAAEEQIKEFNNILEASGSLNLNEITYLNKSTKEQVALMKQAKDLAAQGKTKEAESVHKKILGLQALASFETGTTEKLKDTYSYIANDEKNDEATRRNATEALKEIDSLEKTYLEVYNSDKLNKKQLFTNKINKSFADKQLQELDLEISKKKTELLADIATQTEAGKMASLDTKKTVTVKGEKPGDKVVKEVEETLEFDADDLSKDTSKKFDNDVDNKAYANYKSQVSNFENAKQLKQLQKNKQETIDYMSKLDDDFNKMSSKEYQKQLEVEAQLVQEVRENEAEILEAIVGKSYKEASRYLQDYYLNKYYSKFKDDDFKKTFNALKSNLLNKKKQIEREQDTRKNTAVNTLVNENTRTSPSETTSTEKESSEQEINKQEQKSEVKNQTNPETDETLSEDSRLENADEKPKTGLGGGFTKEEFEALNLDSNKEFMNQVLSEEVDEDQVKEILREEEIQAPPGVIDKDDPNSVLNSMITDLSAEENQGSFEEEDFSDLEDDLSYVELDSNADKEELSNLAKLIRVYKRKKDRVTKKDASFRDFLEDYIENVGEESTENKFYALKDAWQIAGFKIDEDLKILYEDLFLDVGELLLNIDKAIDATSVPALIEESTNTEKKNVNVTEKNEVVPSEPVIDKEGGFSVDVTNRGTAPQLSYLSIKNEFVIDENGIGSRTYINPSQLNPSELDNPHELLNYEKYLPGEELEISLASENDLDKIYVVDYDYEGKPIEQRDGEIGILFNEWVKKNGIVKGSKEYISKIPMVVKNRNGETVAYVRDTDWINPFNFDSESVTDDSIQEAREQNEKVRNAVYNSKDKKQIVVITTKTNGVFAPAIAAAQEFEEQNGRKLTLREAAGYHLKEDGSQETQTKVAIWSDKNGNLQLANNEIVSKDQLMNNEFPMQSEGGSTLYNYEVRQTGVRTDKDGNKIPLYTAFPIVGYGNNDQAELSNIFLELLKLNFVYEYSKSNISNTEKNQDGSPVVTDAQKRDYIDAVAKYELFFKEVFENTGYDFTKRKFDPSGIIGFLETYIRIPEVKLGKSSSFAESIQQIKNRAAQDKDLSVGESFVYRVQNTLYFGNKFIGRDGKVKYSVNFLNLNSKVKSQMSIFNINTDKGKGFIKTLSKLRTKQSISLKGLIKNKNQLKNIKVSAKLSDSGALSLDINDVEYTEGNYQETLFDRLESSVKAYNISRKDEPPFMVTRVQPVISYELKDTSESVSEKETITEKIEKQAEEKVTLENLEGDIEDTKDNVENPPKVPTAVVTEPTTTENVETKKADIERRRQEAKNNPVSEPEEYAKAVDEYKQTELGGSENAKTKKENLVKQAQTKEGKAFVENQVAQLDYNDDGTITVYRSGSIQEGHIPATTDKKTAELIASERKKQGLSSDIVEIKVQPSDISAIVPGVESEVLINVNKDNVERVKENTKKEQKTKVQLESEKESVKNELEKTTQTLEKTKKDKLDGTFPFSDNVYNDTVKKQEAKIKNLKWQLKKYDAELAALETQPVVETTGAESDYLTLADEIQNQVNQEKEKLKDLNKQKQELEKPKAKLTAEQKSNNRKISEEKEKLENEKDNLEIQLQLTEDDNKKENISNQISEIEDQVNDLENQVATPEDNNLEKETYGEEDINSVMEKSNELLSFLNDENFDDLSPIELTEEDIVRMSQDLLRIEGVNPTHQTELVNYLYHETSKTLTEYDGEIDKELLKSSLEDNFLFLLDTKIAVFEKNREILQTSDNPKAQQLVEKYNTAIDYLNTIRSNANILVDEGLSLARKEIGINETKEKREADENPEVNLDNVTEKDHSKTFLEEGGKDKITYKLKRFFSDIPLKDSEGNLVKGIFGVQKYVPFGEMFNNVQSILANTYPNFDKMIEKLENAVDKNPSIKTLIEKLKVADKQTQNQFVTVMSKNDTGMQFISISTTKDKNNRVSYYLDIYDTNSANVTRKIRSKWYNNFKISPVVDFREEKLFINKDRAREILENYRKNQEVLPEYKGTLVKYFNARIRSNISNVELTDSLKKFIKADSEYIFKSEKGYYKVSVDENHNVSLIPYVGKAGSFSSLLSGRYTQQAADSLNEFLNNFGINLSYNTIKDLTENGLYVSKNNKVPLKTLFLEDSDQNIFGSLVTFLEDSLKVKKDEEGNVIEDVIDKDTNNPLSNSRFGSLATLESKYNDNVIMPTSFRDGQKTIQQYTVSKFLTDRILDLASEDPSLRNKLQNSSFSQHSYLLKLLSQHGNLRNSVFNVNYLGINAIKERGGKLFRTTGITDISSADHELVKLGFFINNRLSSVESKLEHQTIFGNIFSMRTAQMVSPTMSDKSTATVVTMPIFNFAKDDFLASDGSIELKEPTVNLMYDQILAPEVQRMFDYYKLINKPNIKAYDKGAKMFLMSPLANKLTQTVTDVNGNKVIVTLPELIKKISENNIDLKGLSIHDFINKTYGLQIKEMFTSYVKNEFYETIEDWKSFGIINYDENNNLSVKGIDSRYLNNSKKFPKSDNVSLDNKVKTLALDFIINNLISNSNMFMTMAGDPAMYYKSKSADPVIQAKDTFENIGKRLANQIAPGIKLADAKDNQYFQIFLSDIEAPASNLMYLAKALGVKDFGEKEIESLKKALSENDQTNVIKDLENRFPKLAPYFKIEGTDAQEYTTWQEHLYILEKLGKTNPELFPDNLTLEDIEQSRALFENNVPMDQMSEKEKNLVKLVMQPMKPVYTGQVYDDNTKTMRTVYIKSSSIPLIPQLTKGLEIDRLRQAMEKVEAESEKTVRASYGSANKVGAITNPAKLFNNGTGEYLKDSSVDELYTKLNNSKLLLDRYNFRIQQEVPFKSGKRKEDYVSQGTQTTKLLFGDGITDMDGFLYNGDVISGRQLKNEYDRNFGELLTLKRKQLLKELNIDLETGLSTNPRVTANKLQALLKEEAESRGYAKQVIDSLSVDLIMENDVVIDYEFTLPLWMSAESNRFESLLNSIATNRIAKVKMPGNSYVASSAEGFKRVVDEKGGESSKIIYTSKFDGELKGAEFNEDGSLKKTQVFLPSKFRDNKGNMLNMFAKDANDNYIYVKQEKEGGPFMLKEEMFDEELLSNISFRTPTSAHLSMADVEIVGFVPYECGDLIIVPRNLTTQVGLDFDIDKQTNYQYYHEVDAATGRVVILDDYIPSINNQILEKENTLREQGYQQKQENLFLLKEKLKEEKKQRKLLLSEYRKSKDSREVEIEVLKEESQNQYSEIQDIKEDIIEVESDLKLEETKEGKEEKVKLLKKLYRDKKLKYKELFKVNNRLKELNVPKSEIDSQKKSISKGYKELKKLKEELKELRKTDREIAALEKRLEKLYKNEIVKIHSSVLSNPSVEVQGKIAKALSIEDSREQGKKITELYEATDDTQDVSLNTFNPLSSKYQKGVMQAGAAGKVGIGAYSNDVVFHSLIRQNETPVGLRFSITFGNLTSENFGQDSTLREDKDKAYYNLLNTLEKIAPDIIDGLSNIKNFFFTQEKGELVKQSEENLQIGYSFVENVLLPELKKEIPDSNIVAQLEYFSQEKRSITDVLTERQNIATDNAKELIMEAVGLNGETLDVDKVMVLLGFDKDMSGNSIPFFFLSQPIIKEFISKLTNLDSKIAEFIPDKDKYVLNELIEKYEFDANPDSRNKIINKHAKHMTGANLESQISNFVDNKNKILPKDEFQHAVLLQFLKLKDIGSQLRSIQKNFNVDSQGIGKSTFDLYDRIDRLSKLRFDITLNNTFKGVDSLIGEYRMSPAPGFIKLDEKLYIKPTTVAGHFAVNTLASGMVITQKELPYNSFSMKAVYNEVLKNSTVSERGAVELKQDVTKHMKMFFNSMNFNLYTKSSRLERKDLFIDNEETGHVSLAKYLNAQLTDPNSKNFKFLNSIPLLKNFEFDIKRDGTPSIIKFNNTTDNIDENSLYNSLYLMLEKNLPLAEINGQTYTTRLLAQDLINYSLLQGGVQEAIQFNKFIPVAFLKNTMYAPTLRSINRRLKNDENIFGVLDEEFKKSNDLENEVCSFTTQYFQHNPNRAATVDFKSSAIKILTKDKKTKEVLTFSYSSAKDVKMPTFLRIYNSKANKNADLYMTNDGRTYFKIPTLGVTGMDSEYDFEQARSGGVKFAESIIPSASEVALLKAKQTSVNTQQQRTPTDDVSETVDTGLFKIEEGNLINTIKEIANDESKVQNKNLVLMAKSILPFLDSATEFEIKAIDNKLYEGRYSQKDNKIYLHPNFIKNIESSKDYDRLAKVILHETIHSITVNELDKHLVLGKNKQIVEVKQGAPKHVKDLVKLFNNFKLKAEQGLEIKTEEEGKTKTIKYTIQQVRNKMIAGLKLNSFENNVVYGALNIREFLTLMASSKDFQEYLHETTYKKTDKSFFDKFKEILTNMLNTIVKKLNISLGISDTVESDFTKGIEATFELIQEGAIDRKSNMGEKLFNEKDENTKEFLDNVDSVLGEKKQLGKPTTQQQATNLGTKTAPIGGNVVIDATKGKSPQPGAVVAFRTKGKTEQNMIDALADNAVGNPFGPYAVIKTGTDGEAVTRFLNWLEGTGDTNVMQNYRNALLAKVPELKGKTIYYYKDLGRPSHATALDYFLNKPTTQSQAETKIPPANQKELDETGYTQFLDENGEVVEIAKDISNQPGFEIAYTPKGKQRQTYTIIGNKIYNNSGKEVFKEDSVDRNKIFANLAIKQGRAKVVEHKGAKYIVNDKEQIISVTTGKIMKWGEENGDRKAILAKAQPQVEKSDVEINQQIIKDNLLKGDFYYYATKAAALKSETDEGKGATKITKNNVDHALKRLKEDPEVIINEKKFIVSEDELNVFKINGTEFLNFNDLETLLNSKENLKFYTEEEIKNFKDKFNELKGIQQDDLSPKKITPVTQPQAKPKSFLGSLGPGFKKGEMDDINIDPNTLGLGDNDLSPVELSVAETIEQRYNLRNTDGKRKKFLKTQYKTVLKKTQTLNKANKNTSFKFRIMEVMGRKGDRRTYYAIAVVPKNNSNFSNRQASKLDDLINDFEQTCK